ncbi:low quality protein: crystallin j1a-like [Plasmopara halstedii]|uniref:Low quality protein: crystallin j1a-like n=1 Tax=Plasmopara halstedii TaxID=4781 RepID=A0A0N7L8G3_PLAHL|nr:low quality protein: crystallin j1a-like [Plasmopara halstedii]CEG49795.1 low quality protein: crystallin j1a-like [Plasmopara halstedii]|eukprot:XP_024586164.1 low quality protein: crystallin j1a-like [Plasmopara halstedii]
MPAMQFSMPTAVERVPESSTANGDQEQEQEEALLRLAARMKQNVATGDRRRHIFKRYRDCFTGMEAVDWMLEQMEAKSVAEAVRKGQGLLSHHYIEKVEKETKFEYNKKRFYRFTATTPEFVQAVERPLPCATLDLPLSAAARRRALAALIGGFVADAASTSLNGVSHPEKTIPNLLRLDFDPAFCGLYDTADDGDKKGSCTRMESSTGFEARILLQCIARRGHIHGSQLAKDAFWGFKNDHRLLSASSRAFIKRVNSGKSWPHCAVKCRSIDVLSLIPIVVALYAGTNQLFTKVDELVKVFYVGTRVRDAALVAAFVLEQVILGASVLQAMRMSIRTERLSVKQRKVIFKAFTKSQLPSYEAIQTFGNRGSLPGGFHAVLQPLFVLNDYPTAVRENIIGGGRTCRRAMFIGACFAAQDGLQAIPEGWIQKTQYFDFIEADASSLVGRREVQGSFTDDDEEDRLAAYGDCAPRSSVSSSSRHLERPDLSRRSSNILVAPTSNVDDQMADIASDLPPEGLPSSHRRSSNLIRHRSNSYASSGGLSSPRSCASNFSYASQNTTASSVRSVIDLGDMDKFYQSGVGNTLSSSTTPSSSSDAGGQLSFEMQKFFQAYGAAAVSRGSHASIGGSRSYGSGSSTVRSSDLAHLRPSDMGSYFRQSSASVRRSGSDPRKNYRHSYVANSRRSENNLQYSHQPRYSGKVSRVSESSAFYRRSSATISYVPEAERSEDVVLAHRMSLDDDQRVSLHAIL